MNTNVACVVVLYNPNEDNVNKIYKYRDYFGKVILVDNSNTETKGIHSDDKTMYIPLKKNYGIAYALNIGIEKAKSLNFEWVMTLDQDSMMTEECVARLTTTIDSCNDSKIAMICANYEPDKHPPTSGVTDIHFAITSGTVMKVSAYSKIGPFINELFIDAVDYEYCYRTISKGYRILRDSAAVFQHVVGNPTYINGIKCRNYPAFRYYFITRNNLIVSKIYAKILPESMTLRNDVKKYRKSAWYESNKYHKQLLIAVAKIDYILWVITGRFHCHIKKRPPYDISKEYQSYEYLHSKTWRI